MMKKFIATLLVTASFLLGMTAFADHTQPMITEAHFYSGLLYYCDAEDGVVVLKDVAVMGKENTTNARTAKDVEYVEIPVVGPAIFKDKTAISLEDCNFYPDSKVRVLITRNNRGELRVLQLKFL